MNELWIKLMRRCLFRSLLVCVVMVAAFWMTGCREEAERTVHVQPLESGAFSGIPVDETRFMIISNRESLDELLDAIHERPSPMAEPLPVEFETHIIVAAFMAEQPTAGYGIFFDEIGEIRDDILEIEVIVASPPEDAIVAQVVTRPYSLAAVELGNYTKVKFRDVNGDTLEVLELH